MSTATVPTLKIVTMTPQKARALLRKNTHNRSVKRPVVERYKDALRAGHWTLTNTAIAVGSNDVLLDGQHRLLACVETDVSFETPLMTNADPDIFVNLDTGVTRGLDDVLKLLGERNPLALAAAIKFCRVVAEDLISKDHRLWKPNNPQALAFLDSHPEVRDYAALANNFATKFSKKGVMSIPGTAVSAFLMLVDDARGDTVEAVEFLNNLITPVQQSADSAVHAVISRVVMARRNRESIPSKNYLYLLVDSFNKWVLGTPMRRAYVAPIKGDFKIPSVIAP